jgi:3-oxoacyl-[acyl-carrier-protein] synthase-1
MSEVDVLSVGMACPLGLRALDAIASLRSNMRSIYRIEDAEQIEARFGEPARASRLLELGPELTRAQRAAFFAQRALHEAASPFGINIRGVPLYLAIPEARDNAGFEVHRLFGELTSAIGSGQFYPSGRAGLFEALRDARIGLERGIHPLAIVGGADSLADAATLMRLAEGSRLLGERNGDGVIPGEGAAFLVLARAGQRMRGQAPLARLGPIAFGTEPRTMAMSLASGSTPKPSHADGLTSVFGQLRQLHPQRVDALHSGQTPQRYWGRELSFATTRNAALMPEPMLLGRCGDALGDLGAAAGAVALVTAILDFHPLIPGRPQPAAMPERALVYACSDEGKVGASLVFALR